MFRLTKREYASLPVLEATKDYTFKENQIIIQACKVPLGTIIPHLSDNKRLV